MPKNRRAGLIAAVLAAAIAVSGCSGQASSDAPGDAGDDRPVVVTTFTVLADIAEVVGGERIDVRSVTRVGAEIHGYEPTPGDLRRAVEADLVIDNGLGLEAWFSQFLAQIEVPRVVASDGIDPIDIRGDAADGMPNPHAWMSPTNAAAYADTIARAFADLDPAGADDYRARAAAFGTELDGALDRLRTGLAAIPERQRALVTCEGAFSYLARDAGLAEAYIWPVNAEREATPQRVADTIAFVTERDVPAVFCESTVSDAAMQQVVRATDADFGGVLYVDSLSEPDGPVPTYLDLLDHDIDTILAGLVGAP